MNDKETMVEAVGELIQKEFGQLNELAQKNAGEITELKSALEKFNLKNLEGTPELKEFKRQKFFVDLMRKTFNNNITDENAFNSLVDAEYKAAYMNEGIAGEGAEFVFTQFDKNIIYAIQQYDLLAELKMYTLNKGKTLVIPTAENTTVSSWAGEGTGKDDVDYSKVGSWKVEITLFKLMTLVKNTEEILNDNMTIPDLYSLIIEMIGESQAQVLEDELCNGTASKMEGLFTASWITTVTLPATKTTLAGLTSAEKEKVITDLRLAVPRKYRKNGDSPVLVISEYVKTQYELARDAVGNKYFPEVKEGKILEFRYVISDEAPMQNSAEDVAGKTFMLLGSLRKYYGVVRGMGFNVTRGLGTDDFENDSESIKAVQRIWGKFLKKAAFSKARTAAS